MNSDPYGIRPGEGAVALGAAVILGLSLASSIIDQHLCSRAVMESHRLRQLADASFEGIMIHEAGIIVAVNQAFCRLHGYTSADSLIERQVIDFFTPDCVEEVRARLQEPTERISELSVLVADGSTRPVEVCSRPIKYEGREARVVGMRDLSARKEAEQRVVSQFEILVAHRLPNRGPAFHLWRLGNAILMSA